MRVYCGMDPRLPLREVGRYAARVEAIGFDGLHVAETVHDSLAVALLACEHTRRMTVRTAVTLAFVRSPTLTAYAAFDLAVFSAGRFQLGLGTQIRQNITDRFAMPWSPPVPRLREYLEALQALYRSFATGEPVSYPGQTYRLSRMQPYVNPGPDPGTVAPPTWLGGVNSGVCELAGALAAGLVTHPTNSDPRYLRQIALPALHRGAAGAGRAPGEVDVVVAPAVITGGSPARLDAERERQRRLLAFLYSTPAYRRTLELYGWADLTPRLQGMIRSERWAELSRLVTDEVLDTLVPTASYDGLGAVLAGRFRGLADGLVLPPLCDPDDDPAVGDLVTYLQEEPS